ncbi:RNA polymerase sigma factor SigJ [Planctomicrobium sp. SH668]|uniref:RNA polymerase sigma factor SigJ n=1 Tax=Planctomicrobium sp. SH668 TaxID=3448126 RepID=UPI003F5BC6FB
MTNSDLQRLRPRMMSVAYRMLGTVADAEDAVQDAFLGLQTAGNVTSPEGFLVKATTLRCIDRLRAERRRAKYIGPWVPEPIATKESASIAALSESLTQAFLLMLERLSPVERAAFLLRSVFDYEYAEIAEIVGKSETHVRQIVSRARSRLEQERPRFHPEPEQADALAERFIAACRSGDIGTIEQMFTDEIEIHSDGGGKATAARVIVRGRPHAARFLSGVFSRKLRDCDVVFAKVNGEPGVVVSHQGTVVLVTSFQIGEGVRAVYMTRNPDKLARWSIAQID